MEQKVTIIGAGLAGCEAALQLSKAGFRVELVECKPDYFSDAHKSGNFAELVCSNSLKSDQKDTSSGLLKEELRMLGSDLIRIADGVRVPAGSALAVDRALFSRAVTQLVEKDANITLVRKKAEDWDTSRPVILAAGPLALGKLPERIAQRLHGMLYFYDAAAPIVAADSIDMDQAFLSSRYGKGSADYINCPMNEEEYLAFYQELTGAERVAQKDFDTAGVFESCMPVEIMAARGVDTLRYGPLRPVGLTDPRTGRRPYAVVQLRRENRSGTMYNLVGFQTNLKFGEQKRVFGRIPALKDAEYLRYGVMHRNTFVNAPMVLNAFFQTKTFSLTFIAGQLSGVEGYVESIASGLMAARHLGALLLGQTMRELPAETMLGALSRYLASPQVDFQPMNANFGLLPPHKTLIKDKSLRKQEYFTRSVQALKAYLADAR